MLRVGFAGTPEFARTALDSLYRSRHRVALVLTQPDRPAGRGMKLLASPVKQAALAAGLPILQPTSLKLDGRYPAEANEAHRQIEAAALDVLVVAAYGLILPPSVLCLPRFGCLNIHASLLPRWRGAAPVQRAIEAGDESTGVTIMQMDAGLDTGPVILMRQCPIEPDMTAGELTARLADLGAQALLQALEAIGDGKRLDAVPQDAEGATYAAKISKAEAQLDWHKSAVQLALQVRAFNPAPGANARLRGEVIKIWRAQRVPLSPLQPSAAGTMPSVGQVVSANARGILVACGEDGLLIESLQRAGGRRVTSAEFLQAEPVLPGQVLH